MLSSSVILLATVVLPQGQGSSTAPVVINEFSYDDTGANDRVFVELYNRSAAPVDISGWVLQGYDGTAATTTNGSVTIPPSTILSAGQFYVIGQALGVPNVDLDVPSMDTVLETGPDGVALLDLASAVIDGVVWEYEGWTNPVPAWLEGDGMFGDTLNSDSNPQSASRVFDGFDNDTNGCDFRVARWSPGTSNDAAHSSGPVYINDFDDPVGSTTSADFNYSFVPGTTEDPATLLLPPSPQGGNCSIWYDPTGGGNANYFSTASRSDTIIECYAFVYGPSKSMDGDDVETWAIGVRGSTDSFGDPPNVNGLYAYAGVTTWDPGITGVAWFAAVDQNGTNLYLVDFNDGGNDFTILHGPIAIISDAWIRLRLSVVGGDVVGNIGGTFGCDDGTRYTASGVSDCIGSAYIQYRENVSAGGAHRPLTLDALRIAPNSAAGFALVGAGSPTTVGVPAITGNGLPTVGNLGFAIDGSNLAPNSFGFMLINIGSPQLPGIQLPGAPTGALLFVNNVGAATILNINGPNGMTTNALPIPCDTLFSDLPLEAQIVDVDLNMPDPLPVGTSPGLSIIVGN